MNRTLHVLTFTYRPVGGVVKTFDYAAHALALGYRVSVRSPEPYEPGLEVFSIDRLSDLPGHANLEFHSRDQIDFGPDDLTLMSLPTDYEFALDQLPPGRSPERIIHLVQNTRHTTPTWLSGYPLRLLTRPATRIATNSIVAEEIRPWLDPRALLRVNNIGHDLDHFAHQRSGGLREPGEQRPIRVAYTTWKSRIGDSVARGFRDDDTFEFRAVRDTATWTQLRELYTWSDVFLSTPNPQEGTYLPGLEAMAAGSLVITPDAGGNMDYCRPGENCLLVDYEDAAGYRAALRELAEAEPGRIDSMRRAGYDATEPFSLEHERDGLAAILDELLPRVQAFEQTSVTQT